MWYWLWACFLFHISEKSWRYLRRGIRGRWASTSQGRQGEFPCNTSFNGFRRRFVSFTDLGHCLQSNLCLPCCLLFSKVCSQSESLNVTASLTYFDLTNRVLFLSSTESCSKENYSKEGSSKESHSFQGESLELDLFIYSWVLFSTLWQILSARLTSFPPPSLFLCVDTEEVMDSSLSV